MQRLGRLKYPLHRWVKFCSVHVETDLFTIHATKQIKKMEDQKLKNGEEISERKLGYPDRPRFGFMSTKKQFGNKAVDRNRARYFGKRIGLHDLDHCLLSHELV